MSTPSFLSIKIGRSARERSSATYLLVSECALRARVSTLTLGHKALLRLRARLAVRRRRHRVLSLPRPIASLWTIEVFQPRLQLPV